MPWVDAETGQLVPDAIITAKGKAASKARFEPYPVTPPSSLADKLTSAAGRILPPAGMMTAGGELGAALGALSPIPGGAALGAMGGSGLANVLAKHLPEAIGGNPKESNTSAFLWGAVPEGVGRGLAAHSLSKNLEKGAQHTLSDLTAQLKQSGSGAEQAGDLASMLNRPNLNPAETQTGKRLTEVTHRVKQAVLGPIDRARKELGEPIGKAYEVFKGDKTPISEAEAQDLADAAQDVSDSMVSPHPKAKVILWRLKNYTRPTEDTSKLLSDRIALPSDAEDFGNGEYVQRGRPQTSAPELGNTASKLAEKSIKPPTRDDLRELRQTISEQIRKSARGGDIHGLLNMRQAIDQHLNPHLPDLPGLQKARFYYRGFMEQFPWKDIRDAHNLGSPAAVSKWAFGGTPERALAITRGARGPERQVLQDALTDHVLRNVVPGATPEAQVEAVSKALEPYIKNGVAKHLFGSNMANAISELRFAPAHRERIAKLLEQPAQAKAFVDEWMKYVRGAKSATAKEAMDRAGQAFLDSLPPAERAQMLKPPVSGTELPVVMAPHEAIGQAALPARQTSNYAANSLKFRGPYALSRLAMGSAGGAAYGASMALAYGGMAATQAGWRAILENGGAAQMGKLYAAKNGRAYARLLFETLTNLGGKSAEQAVHRNDDEDQ